MNTMEQRSVWFRFIAKHYGHMPNISDSLQHAFIIEKEKGCEVQIPVSSMETERLLNTYVGDFVRLLSEPNSEFASLLPVSFSYLRENGTVVPAVTSSPRPSLASRVPLSKEESIRKEQKAFQNSITNQTQIFYCNISNAVNYADDPPEDVKKCKNSLMLILKEYQKAVEVDPSFKRADRFLSATKEPLNKIEKEISAYSDYFKYAYNIVVNRYLDIVFQSARVNPRVSGIVEAKRRIEQFDSIAITELTRERLRQATIILQDLEQSDGYKRRAAEAKKASRLSEKIKSFALEHSSISSGGKRYTSPGLALLMLVVLGFGSIVSLFELILSVFPKLSDS